MLRQPQTTRPTAAPFPPLQGTCLPQVSTTNTCLPTWSEPTQQTCSETTNVSTGTLQDPNPTYRRTLSTLGSPARVQGRLQSQNASLCSCVGTALSLPDHPSAIRLPIPPRSAVHPSSRVRKAFTRCNELEFIHCHHLDRHVRDPEPGTGMSHFRSTAPARAAALRSRHQVRRWQPQAMQGIPKHSTSPRRIGRAHL